MRTLRLVFADHLTREVAALRDIDAGRDVVLMCEVQAEATHVRHHPKKIAFLFSAMRHFAQELRDDGLQVDYVRLDDASNSGSFRGEVERALQRHEPARIVVTWPGEWRILDEVRGWEKRFGLPVEIREDDRFVCSVERFGARAEGLKQLRMELFYRRMRADTGYLMRGDKPVGGKWNFDALNRKPIPSNLETLRPMRFARDDVTAEVLELVARRFADHFGSLDDYWFGATRAQARRALAHFVSSALPRFGDYQDAMRRGDDYLFHSGLSQYLNCGLLTAREVCDAVQDAYDAGGVPLNAAEGYIRQIIGWREYVRGIYWLKMPDYARENRLRGKRDLPGLYWGEPTHMACLSEVIDQTRREALSHHIQRLMITGNFALLLGVEPAQVCQWYLEVYADAFEWVELPNTLGMAMHADGGYLGSKPYAASGNYINKMSDFCKHCAYDVKQKAGADACPFNYLYWNFLIENERVLSRNPRIGRLYGTLERMGAGRRQEISADTREFLQRLYDGAGV